MVGLLRGIFLFGHYQRLASIATSCIFLLLSYPQTGISQETDNSTNAFIDKIPNVIASKTGYTDLAGGNLVVAFDAGLNRPIIISVLGSSQEGRFADALKLIDATIKQLPNL